MAAHFLQPFTQCEKLILHFLIILCPWQHTFLPWAPFYLLHLLYLFTQLGRPIYPLGTIFRSLNKLANHSYFILPSLAAQFYIFSPTLNNLPPCCFYSLAILALSKNYTPKIYNISTHGSPVHHFTCSQKINHIHKFTAHHPLAAQFIHDFTASQLHLKSLYTRGSPLCVLWHHITTYTS